MKKLLLCFITVSTVQLSFSQSISGKLQQAFEKFEADSQLRTAISSFYVIDAKTSAVVFDKNSRVGLPTASTLKIITAATAYELLGRDFRYETKFGYAGNIKDQKVSGVLFVTASGDPTLGSWRWKSTSDTTIINKIFLATAKFKIKHLGAIAIDDKGWLTETIPSGWIWEDIGNYYGAGASYLNWHENQFDVILKSGSKVGDPVSIVNTKPKSFEPLISFVTSAPKGSGDNAYVYYSLGDKGGVVRGTIPVNENAFVISASSPNPTSQFIHQLNSQVLEKQNIKQSPHWEVPGRAVDTTNFFTHYSPALDSIVYWFLKKSINLYGEALVKTFAYRQTGTGSTKKGAEIVRNFWKDKGIDAAELNIVDGSGLSPLNRVTTHAQVEVLKYAKQQPWFDGYFDGFPVYNGMKVKSGTINGTKGFCGYHKSSDGKEYVFSFLVNNYNGSAATLVQKMYKVMDELK
jgi:D-alanyl-D-alanine carboxypeptidase/D-alanyl-D-alanine-endopeptidase (penicillin-binding protein 4)